MLNKIKHIFREYDIRGVVGKDITAEFAFNLGISYSQIIGAEKNNSVMVGYDGRVSSPELANALICGFRKSGLNVINIGLGPTPMLYHAVCANNELGGIMITGSHNPPDQNGFKLMLGNSAFYGKQIQELFQLMQKNMQEIPALKAEAISPGKNYFSDYTKNLIAEHKNKEPLKIVWDAGNGATGEVIEEVTRHVSGQHILLNTKIDGTFPAHHPDPSNPKNMQQLIAEVQNHKADIGIAFDGDGDRIGVVDELGNIIPGDKLLMIYAIDLLARTKNAKIIADVKSSLAFADVVNNHGGQAIFWKTGHSNIKAKMKETGALLAGEMSGHMFFSENYFGFDDAPLAAIRLINILGASRVSFSHHIENLPQYFATPEIRIDCVESEKFQIIEKISAALKNQNRDFLDIDGVRVSSKNSWWLIRASNTESVLVARAEGKTQEELEHATREMKSFLAN